MAAKIIYSKMDGYQVVTRRDDGTIVYRIGEVVVTSACGDRQHAEHMLRWVRLMIDRRGNK